MKLLSKIFLALGLLALVPNLAHAQGVMRICQNTTGANGSNNCVDVSWPVNVVTAITPTVTAGAYASGKSLGGLMTFPVFRTTIRPSGKLGNFSVMSKTGLTGAVTFYIFGTHPATTCTDNTAFALAVGDQAKLVVPPFVLTPAVVGVGAAESTATQSFGISVANADLSILPPPVAATPNLYVCAITAGVTPASTSEYTFFANVLSD